MCHNMFEQGVDVDVDYMQGNGIYVYVLVFINSELFSNICESKIYVTIFITSQYLVENWLKSRMNGSNQQATSNSLHDTEITIQ